MKYEFLNISTFAILKSLIGALTHICPLVVIGKAEEEVDEEEEAGAAVASSNGDNDTVLIKGRRPTNNNDDDDGYGKTRLSTSSNSRWAPSEIESGVEEEGLSSSGRSVNGGDAKRRLVSSEGGDSNTPQVYNILVMFS